MRRFRLLLTLLLCLAIPAQGMTGVLAAVSACPMAQAAAQHPSMSMDDEAADGCCKSASADDQNGKTCKIGQDCSFCGHSVPAVRQTMGFAALMAEEFFVPPSFLPAAPPSGLWRPPALL